MERGNGGEVCQFVLGSAAPRSHPEFWFRLRRPESFQATTGLANNQTARAQATAWFKASTVCPRRF